MQGGRMGFFSAEFHNLQELFVHELSDLLDAENSLTTAQNNYTTALLDYRIAEIQLIKAQGNLKSLLN